MADSKNRKPNKRATKHAQRATCIEKLGGIYCNVCTMVLHNKRTFEQHYRRHKPDHFIYACTACHKESTRYDTFRAHCYNHVLNPETIKEPIKHPNQASCIEKLGGIFCNICKKVLQNKRNFDHHYSLHKPDHIVYTCVACHKEITYYRSFRGHCYTHVLKDALECEICGKNFSKVPALKDHLTKVHAKVYTCPPPCNQRFSTLEKFNEHTASHKISAEYNCQICNFVVSNQEACSKHIESHIEYIYTCPICEESIDKSSGPKHLQKHFDEELISFNEANNEEVSQSPADQIEMTCTICKKIYNNRTDFDIHYEKEHENAKILYRCNVCQKSFDVYRLFSNHCYNHYTKDRFRCEVCDKTFAKLSLLVVHMETAHAVEDEADKGNPFKCGQCEQTFRVGKSLKAHLFEFHGLSLQICQHESCGKMFDSPTSFLFHQIEHKKETENTNRCLKCGMSFKNLRSCFKHIDIHKKAKYACPICQRKFDKIQILKHVQLHYQTVFHSCAECGKIYTLRSRLVEHMKNHKQVLVCTYCKKPFKDKNRLQDHMNIHKGVMPYKCLVCEKTFTAASNWRKHLKRIHNITSVNRSALRIDEANDLEDNTENLNNNEIANAAKLDKNIDELQNVITGVNNNYMNFKSEGNNIALFDGNNKSPDYNEMGGVARVSILDDNRTDPNEMTVTVRVDTIDRDEIVTNNNNNYETIPSNTKTYTTLDTKPNIENHETVVSNPPEEQPMEFDPDEIKTILDKSVHLESAVLPPEEMLICTDQSSNAALPQEYGPDFVNNPYEAYTYEYGNQVINLNDSMLPHINPTYLTVKDSEYPINKEYCLENIIYNCENLTQSYQTTNPGSNCYQNCDSTIISKVYDPLFVKRMILR